MPFFRRPSLPCFSRRVGPYPENDDNGFFIMSRHVGSRPLLCVVSIDTACRCCGGDWCCHGAKGHGSFDNADDEVVTKPSALLYKTHRTMPPHNTARRLMAAALEKWLPFMDTAITRSRLCNEQDCSRSCCCCCC